MKKSDTELALEQWRALNNVIDAWEALPGGKDYPAWKVEAWLKRTLAPAIQKARKAVGRKAPK